MLLLLVMMMGNLRKINITVFDMDLTWITGSADFKIVRPETSFKINTNKTGNYTDT